MTADAHVRSNAQPAHAVGRLSCREVIVTTLRINEGTPDQIVREVVEARTRRLMSELARTPDAWPHRQAQAELARAVQDSLDEWLLLQ